MKKILLSLLLVAATLFTGCDADRPLTQDEIQHQQSMEMQRLQGNQQIAAERAANPNYNNGYSSHSSGMGDVLTGMAIGAMLSNTGGGSSHTTVNKTIVHKTVIAPGATKSVKTYKSSGKGTTVAPIKAKYRKPVAKAHTPVAKKAKYRKKSVNTYKPKARKSSYRKRK